MDRFFFEDGMIQLSKRETDVPEKKTLMELNVIFIEFECSYIPQRRISLSTKEKGFILVEFDDVRIHSSSDQIIIDLSLSIGKDIRLFLPLSKFRFASYSYHIENMMNEIGHLLKDSEVEAKVKNECKIWLLFLRGFLKELYERRNDIFDKSKVKVDDSKENTLDEVVWIINTLQSINALEELCNQK